ncbi:MAG: glycogen/starch synthase [Anaerolineales bacterium]
MTLTLLLEYALKDPIKVLFLTAEADPLVKIGELGDVAGSLPAA